ncbi:MAG: NUDIX hydrolase [Anaerolineae bacterium]|nr:NUDIX hydrolase [Anaerolineae bacterium]
MSHDLPTITTPDGQRVFACVPAAVLVFIVNEDERILMLSNPKSGGRWEVINGALEHGETLLEGCLRETREEAGPNVRVRPLSLLHVYSFPYAENIPHMLSICYLFAYEGGEVIPGDDMAGSAVRWASVDEIASGAVEVLVPRYVPWLFERAIELYRMLADRPPAIHQPPMEYMSRRKYPK